MPTETADRVHRGVSTTASTEKKGTPTATINSDEFATLQASRRRDRSAVRGLPIVTVPHPMGGISEQQVRDRASTVVDEIVHVLTTDRDQLESEYGDRYLDSDESVDESGLYCPL